MFKRKVKELLTVRGELEKAIDSKTDSNTKMSYVAHNQLTNCNNSIASDVFDHIKGLVFKK